MYRERSYRHDISRTDLVSYEVRVKETDLLIRSGTQLKEKAAELVFTLREQLETYIETHPPFLKSMKPLPSDRHAPEIIRIMIEAGQKTGVGPMAAVAGAVAESVGNGLLNHTDEVIVENGGDIFARVDHPLTVGIFCRPITVEPASGA